MDFTTIHVAATDQVLVVTLDRPDRMNAFTGRMQREICSALDIADEDPTVRAVVFTGRGRGFCAGADLESGGETFVDRRTERDGPRSPQRDGGGVVALRIYGCTKPVIAAINGAAVGVGATMTLPMDIRLASTSAKFGFVFTRRGIMPDACSSWFLPRVVGISTALEWTMGGEIFGADEALRGGLVRSIHEPDELLPAALAMAASLASSTSAVSVALTRQLMWRMLGESHPMAAHNLESNALAHLGKSADAREGIMAFLEKRSPAFADTVPHHAPEPWPFWSDPEFRPTGH